MPRRNSTSLAMVAIAALAVLFAARIASGADPERGRALYELRCGTCHSDSVHGRKTRVAADFDDIRRWVMRWNENLALRWSGEEVDDVSVFLNSTYYRYACPPQVCKVVSLAPSSGLPGRAAAR